MGMDFGRYLQEGDSAIAEIESIVQLGLRALPTNIRRRRGRRRSFAPTRRYETQVVSDHGHTLWLKAYSLVLSQP